VSKSVDIEVVIQRGERWIAVACQAYRELGSCEWCKAAYGYADHYPDCPVVLFSDLIAGLRAQLRSGDEAHVVRDSNA
jgi:hypothetical protein